MGTTSLFGLTGGIASGKSSVAAVFAARGVPVVDADQLARDVVRPGSPALAELVDAFGPSIVTDTGELDRKALAALAFVDGASRAKLNAITHPRIGAATAAEIARLSGAGVPVACYEAALLVENGLADAFRPLVVVVASEAAQLVRAMRRDGATEAEVRARISAQLPLAAKRAAADFTIDNDGELSALTARADEVLTAVLARMARR